MANVVPNTTIVGNLTADPKVFGTDSKYPRAVFTLAHNSYNRDSGEYDIANFYQMTLFGEPGMNFANSHSKGDRIMAVCRLSNHTKEVYDDEGEAFNLTQITLNAITAGPTNEFDQTERVEVEKTPRKKAAKAKRPSPKAEEEEADEVEETEEAEETEEEAEEKPKPAAKKSGGTRQAPARRAPRRRAPARA